MAETEESPAQPEPEGAAEDEEKIEAPERMAVTRTPVRPAGDVRETPSEAIKGLVLGAVMFVFGLWFVRWSFVRWLMHGGSSTVLGASVLLPVTIPLVVGSIIAERGRKAMGYMLIGGVMVGTLAVSMYLFARMYGSGASLMESVGASPLPAPR